MSDADLAAVARIRRTAESIAGPGMGTSISYTDLRAMLNVIDDTEVRAAQAERAVERLSKRTGRGKAKAASKEVDPELLVAVAEILEGRPELWGKPLPEALAALCAQQHRDMPEEWTAALSA